MTHADFQAWHARMGYTYGSGAAALGVSRSAYANLLRGTHRDTGAPVQYDRRTALGQVCVGMCSAWEFVEL